MQIGKRSFQQFQVHDLRRTIAIQRGLSTKDTFRPPALHSKNDLNSYPSFCISAKSQKNDLKMKKMTSIAEDQPSNQAKPFPHEYESKMGWWSNDSKQNVNTVNTEIRIYKKGKLVSQDELISEIFNDQLQDQNQSESIPMQQYYINQEDKENQSYYENNILHQEQQEQGECFCAIQTCTSCQCKNIQSGTQVYSHAELRCSTIQEVTEVTDTFTQSLAFAFSQNKQANDKWMEQKTIKNEMLFNSKKDSVALHTRGKTKTRIC